MKKRLIYLISALFAFTGCITNDLPYPVVVPNVTSVIVDEAEKIDIDYSKRVITIYLPETQDIRTVSIRSVQVDQEIAHVPEELSGVHDLTNPLRFTITTYQDYEWTIVGVRNVTRYFTVQGQVGASVIDEVNHRVLASVGKDEDIENITVTSLKLGAEGKTTYSIPMEEMKDFSAGIYVDVTEFDYTETWTIFVEVTDASVEVQKVNAWANMAYVTSIGVAGVENGFQYREMGASEWIDVPAEDITSDGGSFVAHIKGLRPETEYEVVAVCEGETSPSVSFITESAIPVPNGSFEYASLVSGASYYKFYDPDCGFEDGSYMFWGSGNGEGSEGVNGSASMGIVITYIDKDEKVDGQQSVRAQTSQLAGILAAGNLFTGQFAGLVGTEGGKVNFGRPWTSRPRALKLYCKYSTGKMNIINGMPSGVSLSSADYDRAQIKVAVGNWDYRTYGGTPDSPVLVNTTDSKTFVDFAVDNSTIAYGELTVYNDGYTINRGTKVSGSTEAWVEYTIPLDYSKVDELPTHIIISCAASQYGDYFTGYNKSKLWLDAFELIY